jgi:hypothetical protein
VPTAQSHIKGQLSIHNISGKQLITRQIAEPKTQLDISSLPSGVFTQFISSTI